MYCDERQWREIRRRILEQGAPKKRVSAETGTSRQTINKMLAHEQPPGYRRRRSRYPKLAPHIHTIDRLLIANDSNPPTVNMTIQDIVQHLRPKMIKAAGYKGADGKEPDNESLVSRAGRSEEGRRHRGSERFGAKAVVEIERVAGIKNGVDTDKMRADYECTQSA